MSKYCPYRNSNIVYTECIECENKICSPDTFFCLVVGSRSFTDYEKMKNKLDKILSNFKKVVIVSGGAHGADSLAEKYAEMNNYPCIVFPADWNTFGRSAGYIRNEQMHKFIAKQPHRGVVAFWDGQSRGTQQNFQLAEKYYNDIRIIKIPHN